MIGEQFIARQLREPSGFFGRTFMGRLLNKGNARINQHAVDALKVQPGDTALDIGFGGGIALSHLLQHATQGSVHGAEISTAMLKQAQSTFVNDIRSGRLKLHEASVEALPFTCGRVQRVCSVNTIYFWNSAAQGMREVHRILAPGGAVVIGIRSAEVMQAMPVTQHGFRLFTSDEISDVMRHAGLTNIEVTHQDQDQRHDSLLIRGVKPT